MIDKPYGKFTLDQLKQFNELVRDTRNLNPTFEKILRETDPQKLKAILGDNFSWFKYYEMPFNDHIAWSVLILDWQDELKRIAKSEDPQQAVLDFMGSPETDKEWQGGFQGYFKKSDLIAVVVSIIRTIKSIMIFQKSLSALIEEVRLGSEKALFDAVRIDRSIVGSPSVMHHISIAEMKGDKKFFLHLKSALDGPSGKYMASLELMRYMMIVLVDAGVNRINGENLEMIFVDHLKLYSKQPSAQKNLYEQFLKTKRINHLK